MARAEALVLLEEAVLLRRRSHARLCNAAFPLWPATRRITAKARGLTIPPSLLARADQVIE